MRVLKRRYIRSSSKGRPEPLPNDLSQRFRDAMVAEYQNMVGLQGRLERWTSPSDARGEQVPSKHSTQVLGRFPLRASGQAWTRSLAGARL
ncbi:hypothetical protein RRG08_018978 [Elysia crispata]|uniref:Uncharacterized protein n=1 Tax=Elysia crispata TaxID=231223 RepID=A0AAE1DSQ9_9GAST|nr:hypothetical protein RRG08_018978 [Elysia crispata]